MRKYTIHAMTSRQTQLQCTPHMYLTSVARHVRSPSQNVRHEDSAQWLKFKCI